VARAGGHENGEPGLDSVLDAVEHGLAFAFLDPERLLSISAI
jgi:hypothetical protein